MNQPGVQIKKRLTPLSPLSDKKGEQKDEVQLGKNLVAILFDDAVAAADRMAADDWRR